MLCGANLGEISSLEKKVEKKKGGTSLPCCNYPPPPPHKGCGLLCRSQKKIVINKWPPQARLIYYYKYAFMGSDIVTISIHAFKKLLSPAFGRRNTFWTSVKVSKTRLVLNKMAAISQIGVYSSKHDFMGSD